MLNRIIATALCCAALVSSGMIASANDSNAVSQVFDENGFVSTSTESTVAETDTSVEATTTTEAEQSAEVGASVRKDLGVNVRDVVYFSYSNYVADADGNWRKTQVGEDMWIAGVDDVNQRFRVYVPRLHHEDETKVYYLYYLDVKEPKIINSDGIIVGDLDYNCRVDIVDLALMKRFFINGWPLPIHSYLADIDADGKATVVDIIALQKWLLGTS